MKNAKSMFIALLAAALITAGSFVSQAHSLQQATDQTKTDSNAVKQSKDKLAGGAATQKKRSSRKSAVSTASTSPTAAPEDASGGAAPASDQPALGQRLRRSPRQEWSGSTRSRACITSPAHAGTG